MLIDIHVALGKQEAQVNNFYNADSLESEKAFPKVQLTAKTLCELYLKYNHLQ